MQVWNDLLIFLLISFSCVVVQFALLYPTVGGFFCAGDLNENQPQRKLYEADIEKNNSTQEKEQELTNKCLTNNFYTSSKAEYPFLRGSRTQDCCLPTAFFHFKILTQIHPTPLQRLALRHSHSSSDLLAKMTVAPARAQ